MTISGQESFINQKHKYSNKYTENVVLRYVKQPQSSENKYLYFNILMTFLNPITHTIQTYHIYTLISFTLSGKVYKDGQTYLKIDWLNTNDLFSSQVPFKLNDLEKKQKLQNI